MDEEQWKSGAKTRDQLLLCSLLLPKVTRNGKKRREREKTFFSFFFFSADPPRLLQRPRDPRQHARRAQRVFRDRDPPVGVGHGGLAVRVRTDDEDRRDVFVGGCCCCRRRGATDSVSFPAARLCPPRLSPSSSSRARAFVAQLPPHKLPQRHRVRRDAAQGDAGAPWRQVQRDGSLDDLEQLVAPAAVARADAQLLQQLREQPAEALERAREPDGRADPHHDVLRGRDIEGLDLPGLGQRRVEQRQQGLVRDVRAGARRVTAVPAEEGGVVVAVEEDVGLGFFFGGGREGGGGVFF